MVEELNIEKVWELLNKVPDPEIPVLSVVELGVVRDVYVKENRAEVTITPTYSGCPAMKTFSDDIISQLKKNGFEEVIIHTAYNPPWTTDWMSETARTKLKEYGIAPPQGLAKNSLKLFAKNLPIPCPRCESTDTRRISEFGSTACKSLHQCNTCLDTFDYFKCI
ncbi:MAG TPA: phenylacetate-CoA oxygenase subunit PaaJ [Flavobacteriales bacterium]|jgi:ring-1,2-phenylacetyl-CoA epoxidase subunit PaaD|nr:phenylacetate-CoA oxygenase subunit PaaJ [Flavobacteriales bacterium]